MNRAEIDTAVAAYWNARAPKFDAAASHVRHAEEWRRVLAAAFDATGPSDVVDLGCEVWFMVPLGEPRSP